MEEMEEVEKDGEGDPQLHAERTDRRAIVRALIIWCTTMPPGHIIGDEGMRGRRGGPSKGGECAAITGGPRPRGQEALGRVGPASEGAEPAGERMM